MTTAEDRTKRSDALTRVVTVKVTINVDCPVDDWPSMARFSELVDHLVTF